MQKAAQYKCNRTTTLTGFTLVELIIGIGISSMLFLAISSIIVILFTSSARVTQLDTMEQAKNDIASELANNIRWAKSVSISADQKELTVVDAASQTSVYAVNGQGRLTKNGSVRTVPNVIITSITFADYSRSSAYASVKAEIHLEHAQFAAIQDTMRVVATQRVGAAQSP